MLEAITGERLSEPNYAKISLKSDALSIKMDVLLFNIERLTCYEGR